MAPPPCEAREAGAGVGGVSRDTVIDALAPVEAGTQGQAHGGCGHGSTGVTLSSPDPRTLCRATVAPRWLSWLPLPMSAGRPGGLLSACTSTRAGFPGVLSPQASPHLFGPSQGPSDARQTGKCERSSGKGRNARGPRRGSPGVSALGLVDQGPSDPPGGLQSVSGAAIVRDRACGAAPPVSLCVQWAACPLEAIQAAVAQGPLLALPEATRPQQAVQRAWLTEPRDLFREAKLLEPADLWPRTPPGLWVSFGTQPRCHLVCWGLAALH